MYAASRSYSSQNSTIRSSPPLSALWTRSASTVRLADRSRRGEMTATMRAVVLDAPGPPAGAAGVRDPASAWPRHLPLRLGYEATRSPAWTVTCVPSWIAAAEAAHRAGESEVEDGVRHL